jgi:putative DNA primase/helicase
LPGYLGEYADAVSRATQTPPALAVSMILGVLATALQGRFEVAPKGNGYREPVNLWTACILPPASRKSEVVRQVTRPLRNWETAKIKELTPLINQTAARREVAKRRIDAIKLAASKPSATEAVRESAFSEISEIETTTPEEIVAPRLFCDDVTPEALQTLLVAHDERMGLISDEGGIFSVISGLYTNGQFNNNVFLQSHAGSPVRVDRQGRSITLRHPALSFALAIQPTILTDMTAMVKRKFRGNGTLGRFLFFMPENTVGKRDVTADYEIPASVRQTFDGHMEGLLCLPEERDEAGYIVPTILTPHPEAKAAWLRFAAYIEIRLGDSGDLPEIQDWAGKLPGAAARIAGLLHVATTGGRTNEIGLPAMESALDLSDYLLSHAKAVFGLIGQGQGDDDAKAILHWLSSARGGEFTQRDVGQRFRSRIPTADRIAAALKELTARNIISEPQPIQTGGRPTIVFFVNPAICEGV